MSPPNDTGSLKDKRQMKSPSPLFGDREVHFHIGAHKTATTFLQNTFRRNVHLLASNGILYIPLNEMRSTKRDNGPELTNKIVSLTQADRNQGRLAALRKEIADAAGRERLDRSRKVLISEENLSLQLDGYLKGEAFSCLGRRLRFLKEEFGNRLKVFFSIRNYPDFLSSAYVEILRHHDYISFPDFLEGIFHDLPSLWMQAYHELVGLVGEDNVVFWDFQDTIRNPHAVLSMLSWNTAGFDVDNTPARPSLSQKAVEFIRDFRGLPGEVVPAAVLSKMADRLYPLSKSNSKFDPWNPQERKALSEHYRAEIHSIPLKSFPDASK